MTSILLGAIKGIVAAFILLTTIVVVLEVILVPHGFTYSDVTLATVMFMTVMYLPIMGGWWAWVLNRKETP